MEEQELARRCAGKDIAAQRELYEEYRSRILALCRRYAEDPADAEDMMQDAFIKIFKNIGSFLWTRPGSLYSWMSRVAINQAFDSSKRRRNLARQLVDINQLADDIPEESVYDETVSIPSDVLNEMIEALPEGYRTVFKLYCIDGCSHREIADLLGIKEKSSSASLSRARAILADTVRQYWRHLDNDSLSDGWTSIIRKMRREKTIRNISLIFSLLIPVAALMLWQQASRSPDPSIMYSSQITAEIPSIIVRHSFSNPQNLMDRIAITQNNISAMPENEDDTVVIIIRNEDTGINQPSDAISNPLPDPLPDAFSTIQNQDHKSRPKISFGLKAESVVGRRNAQISLDSSPYIASLTFMNSVNPADIPHSKSNVDNAVSWYMNNYFPTEEEECPDTKSKSRNTGGYTHNSVNSYNHDLPVTFGLSVHMDLNSRFGAECGIDYTYMHSKVETVVGLLSQNLHFIGVPVRLDMKVWSWKGLDMYAGLGIKAEKCIAASFGQIQCEEKRMQWSAETYAGVQYKVGKHVQMYFQPDISYYFTKTDLITYRTENPLTVSMNLGLRFDL